VEIIPAQLRSMITDGRINWQRTTTN
jgi:hypothetical protein